MKSVLSVVPSLVGGGAELVAVSISKHQATHFDSHIVTWLAPHQSITDVTHHALTKKYGGILGSLILVFKLKNLINRLKPDFIISHLTFTNLIASLATSRSSKLVLVHHIAENKVQNFFAKKLLSKAYKRHTVVAVSSEVAKFLIKELGPVSPIVIENPLRLPNPLARTQSSSNLKVVSVGRLNPQKNYPLALETLASLPEGSTLTIVGPGDPSELKRLSEKLGIASRVTFAGSVAHEEVINFLDEADVFLMTSFFEGEPSSLLEAAAAGVPVVGVDSPGLGDAVRKVGGFLTSASATADEIAETVVRASVAQKNTLESSNWTYLHEPDFAGHRYCEILRQP